MKNRFLKITLAASCTAAVSLVTGCKTLKAHIVAQPQDQIVPLGSPASFTIQAQKPVPFQWHPLSYQWQRNLTPNISKTSTNWMNLSSETNSSLNIPSAHHADVGFYRVRVSGSQEVISDTASLQVFTTTGTLLTLFGGPVMSSGTGAAPCPSGYVGYVNYKKPLPDWGWVPIPGVATYIAADATQRADTKIEMSGSSGDHPCSQTPDSATGPLKSAKYRFTVYFPNNVPSTNQYPINLTGFNP